jgi:hypothetical protein
MIKDNYLIDNTNAKFFLVFKNVGYQQYSVWAKIGKQLAVF